jgi:hypothetical protein
MRLCLDDAYTNKQLADHLGAKPASVIYHVRSLVRAGFLAPQDMRRGRRGAKEIPYRATGKSWTLDVGPKRGVMVAQLDAFRADLLEGGPRAVITSTRLGVRLTPQRIDELKGRLMAVADEAATADTPDGEAVSLYIGLHRRRRP